jgi:hypothetical protein
MPRTRDARQVVSTVTLGKDVYFRRWRRACQFRRREDFPRRDVRSGNASASHACGAVIAVEPLADAARERGLAEHEERHVRAKARRDLDQRLARKAQRPQAG